MPSDRLRPAGGRVPWYYATASRLAGAGLRLRAATGSGVWRERLVVDDPPPPAAIWFHAASVGELNSARMVIEALAEDPGVIVTTNSTTGRDLARSRGRVARLAPFDSPGATARFLAAVRPRLQLTVEGEFWPNRAELLARAGIPQAVIGARMSERSARQWGRIDRLIRPGLSRIAALSAQDAASEARLLSLGLRPEALLPRLDLKLLGPAAVSPPPPSAMRDRTVLAASTHEGEDAPIIEGWIAARAQCPDLRLILAPRHPDRAGDIAALMTARGLDPARRSAGADESAQVLLADTLGEMGHWYAAAGLCITGGSLVPVGGHTPWEPAAYACAILHGPDVPNFTESYGMLDSAGAAIPVTAVQIAPTLIRLASDPERARAMGRAARQTLDTLAGDPAWLIEHIRALARTA